jgi:hypothetical protein
VSVRLKSNENQWKRREREMLAVQSIELMTCRKNLQREWKGDLLTGEKLEP